jgi:hypothetical protein
LAHLVIDRILDFSRVREDVIIVRKNATHKESHKKSLKSIEQRLMAGPNCQAGPGKDSAALSLGKQWLL